MKQKKCAPFSWIDTEGYLSWSVREFGYSYIESGRRRSGWPCCLMTKCKLELLNRASSKLVSVHLSRSSSPSRTYGSSGRMTSTKKEKKTQLKVFLLPDLAIAFETACCEQKASKGYATCDEVNLHKILSNVLDNNVIKSSRRYLVTCNIYILIRAFQRDGSPQHTCFNMKRFLTSIFVVFELSFAVATSNIQN